MPVFSAAFATAYVLAVENNWALLTYHPATGAWGLGVEAAIGPRQPAMYWYGWLLSAFLAATIAGGIATLVPRAITARLRPSAWSTLIWAIPMACMLVVLYVLRGYFLRGH